MLMSDGLRWCMQYLGSVQPLDWIFFFFFLFFLSIFLLLVWSDGLVQ